jgi:hypothetical protein
MFRPPRKLLFLATVCLVGAALTAHAAKTATGSFAGVVLDAKGVPASAAQVFWQASDGTRPHELHTDSNGHFRITLLRPGLYELRAEAGGMWSEWEHNTLVRAGTESKVTLRLLRKSPPEKPAGSAGQPAGKPAGKP